MQSIRTVARLNETELEKVIPPNASWHTDYRDTAYIYIGGLPFELSEGDILTIFSQYGNPVHVNLVRDKDTGKSRGFAFLKYEDQRSCDLAVDNLSGAGVMGRVVSVDHTRYKVKEGEVEGAGLNGEEEGDETDREGDSRGKKRRKSEEESEEERPMVKEELELQKLLAEHDEDDPMKAFLVEEKRAEVAEALKGVVGKKGGKEERKHRHRHRSRREEDGERRNGHKSRRERSDSDEDRKQRPRKHHRRDRSASPASSDEEREARRRKHRRDRSVSSDSGEERRRRKHRSRRDEDSDDERLRRRGKGRDEELPRRMQEHSLSDRSRSRERRRR